MAIEERISAAEANRSFSRLLRGVREGKSFVVTAHGRPIARLAPITDAASPEARLRDAAWRELLARLETQAVVDIGRWTRDELYEP